MTNDCKCFLQQDYFVGEGFLVRNHKIDGMNRLLFEKTLKALLVRAAQNP